MLFLPMLRSKPELMTFHCYTGEMNEATKYYPINNGLLIAEEEVSSTRFPRTQAYSISAISYRKNVVKCCYFQEYLSTFKKYSWILVIFDNFIIHKIHNLETESIKRRGNNKRSTCQGWSQEKLLSLAFSGVLKPLNIEFSCLWHFS